MRMQAESNPDGRKKRKTFAYGRDPDRPEYVWPGVRHRELLKPPLSKERKQYYRQFGAWKWVPDREFDPETRQRDK